LKSALKKAKRVKGDLVCTKKKGFSLNREEECSKGKKVGEEEQGGGEIE